MPKEAVASYKDKSRHEVKMQVEKWKEHERENKAKQKPVAKRCLFVFVVINFLCINQSINKCGGRMVVGSKSIILSFCQSHSPPGLCLAL